jgi:hypothetical protein
MTLKNKINTAQTTSTKLRQTSKTSKALITTVPIELVHLLNLTTSDHIIWNWNIRPNNTIDITINFNTVHDSKEKES